MKLTKGKRRLPSWLDHFNAHDLKVLFRCWAATWVAALLMFVGPTLHTIGTETFFACIVLFILPPSGILLIFLLGEFTLLIGMSLAWAWGVIVMKAALAARSPSQTQAQLAALQQQASTQANASGQSIASEAHILVLNGFMLDAPVTAVFFVLICLFIYFMARLRTSNPKFALLQIYAIIISDLFLTLGPSQPSFYGTLPVSLIKAAAVGVGLGFVASILFIPQSTSHTFFTALEGLLKLAKQPLEFTISSLENDSEKLDVQALQKVKAEIVAAYKAMELAIAFLPLDCSIGRWNADDIKTLRGPIRQSMMSSLLLLEYHSARLVGQKRLQGLLATSDAEDTLDYANGRRPREVGRYQLMQSAQFLQALRSPESEAIRSETVEVLRGSVKVILPACLDAITAISECIHTQSSGGWFTRPSNDKHERLLHRCSTSLEALKSTRSTFTTETTERLLQLHADLFDETSHLPTFGNLAIHPFRGVMFGMVFETQILFVTDALEKLLERIIQLCQGRTKDKLWFPVGIRYAAAWAFNGNVTAPIPGQSNVIDPNIVDKQAKEAQRRLRISRGYGVKRRSGLARSIIATNEWLFNSDGLYALRMIVLTVALAIPAVIPSSAGFYYREKGIWGLIMGQTTLLVYMADFTFSMISRTIGTVVGGVLGLLVWYTGSANGPGNPYGLAAISAAVLAVLMWGRLFFNPTLLQATIMSAATCILIVGYSFDDTHIAQYGNPGFGYNVFWHRLVLVLIGFAAALIVQLLPLPPSASRHITKTLSNTLQTLSDHYALVLSCWNKSDSNVGLVAGKVSIEVDELLASLEGSIALLRLEFSGSPFDSQSLAQMKSICQEINWALGRLIFLSVSLPVELQDRLTHLAGILDHRNIGDIMAVLSMVEQALKTGNALPEVIPTPLLNRCHEYWQNSSLEIIQYRDLIRDKNYRKFCVAVSSYLKFLSKIDELVLVVKGSLGESHIISKELPEGV
ncbi:hypothetical protein BDV27DRAFT_132999 [Aspergillus caelatus]|uniref:Fusaric acid resistance protein-like-domain-containing protein n=1 Tax=Aspergillus caelatus TaxID=61420 RepID=A0A5N6ZV53_9EURO|nr:uncharacterized protein BDV27DRAFT_132999 [Aspergillus caelatus]KAE8361491.1 hypothetical protein BDV27DRAFT_132999 [Aspergillus caelatus]